jgi:hypothetical protein
MGRVYRYSFPLWLKTGIVHRPGVLRNPFQMGGFFVLDGEGTLQYQDGDPRAPGAAFLGTARKSYVRVRNTNATTGHLASHMPRYEKGNRRKIS